MFKLTLYVGGHFPISSGSPPQIEQKQCLSNLADVLNATNSSWDKVVKVNIYLKNMDDFDKVNETYTQVCLTGSYIYKISHTACVVCPRT